MQARSIVINGRYLTQPTTGVQRVAWELVRALDMELAEGRLRSGNATAWLAAPKGAAVPEFRAIRVASPAWLSGHLWEQFEFPLRHRRSVKVNLCGAAPIASIGQVVAFHDAAVFRHPTAFARRFSTWYRLLFLVQGVLARNVVTVSQFSRSELTRYCSIPESKIRVVSPAADHVLRIAPDDSILTHLGLTRQRYALCVGSIQPNKNFSVVQKAANVLCRSEFEFVVVGGAGERSFRTGVTASDSLKYVGRASDAELVALYRGAFCFISPSLYEGFGIPPLEAMLCGCPVIAAKAAATPETCGEAALYFDPADPDDLARCVTALFEDGRLRDDLRRRGLDQAARFSWREGALQLWQIIADSLCEEVAEVQSCLVRR